MDIVDEIKKSKKYKHISKEIIKKYTDRVRKKYPKANEKSLIKEVKSELHKIAGFSKDIMKREKLLGKGDYVGILKTNQSTNERLKDYRDLYKEIFEITGIPKSILDLACGINPISIIFMDFKPNYYAYDINEADVEIVNKFFKQEKIKGKAEVMDVSKIGNIKKLPKTDICFLFKALDVLENKGHKYSEELIKALKCKYIVASFATKTIGGKKMRYGYRGWIERMLERIGYSYHKRELSNEVFYIISKP